MFKFPVNGQLRINGWVERESLANPDSFDSNGEPCIVVMKDGNSSDLTVGRCAGLDAYICNKQGVESQELAIYNYDKQFGPFSSKGDSGSLIFDGKGRMVGILHSGISKGGSSLVTYATPAWWAIEQLKVRYPHADFNRDKFYSKRETNPSAPFLPSTVTIPPPVFNCDCSRFLDSLEKRRRSWQRPCS